MKRNIDFLFFDIRGDGNLYFGNSVRREVEVPDLCPMCKALGAPLILSAYDIEVPDGYSDLVATLFCVGCRRPFMAAYHSDSERPYSVEPSSVPSRSFDDVLNTLSPQFVETYNQASAAESYGLNEICGMGFRRALEFLVKDYLISRDPPRG